MKKGEADRAGHPNAIGLPKERVGASVIAALAFGLMFLTVAEVEAASCRRYEGVSGIPTGFVNTRLDFVKDDTGRQYEVAVYGNARCDCYQYLKSSSPIRFDSKRHWVCKAAIKPATETVQ